MVLQYKQYTVKLAEPTEARNSLSRQPRRGSPMSQLRHPRFHQQLHSDPTSPTKTKN